MRKTAAGEHYRETHHTRAALDVLVHAAESSRPRPLSPTQNEPFCLCLSYSVVLSLHVSCIPPLPLSSPRGAALTLSSRFQAYTKAKEAGKELEVVYVPVADSLEVRTFPAPSPCRQLSDALA